MKCNHLCLEYYPNHIWHVVLMHSVRKVRAVKDNFVSFDSFPRAALTLQSSGNCKMIQFNLVIIFTMKNCQVEHYLLSRLGMAIYLQHIIGMLY